MGLGFLALFCGLLMDQLIHYNACPGCGSPSIRDVFRVKDHTVSREEFLVMECSSCTLRFTQDVPSMQSIGTYYKSEDYISHSHSAKGFINRIYYRVRKRTLVRKRKLVQRITGLSKGRILDIGSGTGLFAAEMQQAGWAVTGLEPDADARAIAQKDSGVRLEEIGQFYQLADGTFDAITMWHVLEHVHDLQPYLEKLKTLLSANGRLFIAVPNYTSLDADIYQNFWAAYDVPRHLYHFSPEAMQSLVESHGLRIRGYKPMWYDSFYISLVSSRYKNGRTNWITASWNGFRSNLRALFDIKKCSSVIYVVSK